MNIVYITCTFFDFYDAYMYGNSLPETNKAPENWLSQTDMHLPMYGIFPYIYVPYKSKNLQVIIDHIEMYHKIEQHAGFIDRIEHLE